MCSCLSCSVVDLTCRDFMYAKCSIFLGDLKTPAAFGRALQCDAPFAGAGGYKMTSTKGVVVQMLSSVSFEKDSDLEVS